MSSQFTYLKADKLIETIDRLEHRITERFPDSGLAQVGIELSALARDCANKAATIARPAWSLRLILLLVLGLWGVSVYYGASLFTYSFPENNLAALLGWIEPAMNIIVSVGIAVWFLISLEGRFKRHKAIKALNELRSMAHIIDMHQLTKDPSLVGCDLPLTTSSPVRNITEGELLRYLDYCSELLSLTGKLAAIYAQNLPSSTVITSVNEIETLTTDLSRKVWQKIMVLHKYNQAS
jgi:hypothetical protein